MYLQSIIDPARCEPIKETTGCDPLVEYGGENDDVVEERLKVQIKCLTGQCLRKLSKYYSHHQIHENFGNTDHAVVGIGAVSGFALAIGNITLMDLHTTERNRRLRLIAPSCPIISCEYQLIDVWWSNYSIQHLRSGKTRSIGSPKWVQRSLKIGRTRPFHAAVSSAFRMSLFLENLTENGMNNSEERVSQRLLPY